MFATLPGLAAQARFRRRRRPGVLSKPALFLADAPLRFKATYLPRNLVGNSDLRGSIECLASCGGRDRARRHLRLQVLARGPVDSSEVPQLLAHSTPLT